MNVIQLNTLGFIQKIKEHEEFKKYMLDYINERNSDTIESYGHVSYTDWNHNTNVNRQYVTKIGKILQPYLNNVAKKLKATEVIVSNIWFQHYEKDSGHNWHYHTESNWSAIYYIDLPDIVLKTQLFDLHENKILSNTNIEEGDLFIFPSTILHRSPVNRTNNTKTVISFNLNFDGVFI